MGQASKKFEVDEARVLLGDLALFEGDQGRNALQAPHLASEDGRSAGMRLTAAQRGQTT
jgi:hypothetical protein